MGKVSWTERCVAEGSLEAEIGVLVLSQRTEVVVAFEEVDFWKTGAQHSRGHVYLL
jgi:hypothetical protein